MRRTLIVCWVLAATVIALLPAYAEMNWSAGVSLTEEGSSVSIGSRIEATRDDQLIGCWFSSTGQLPVMVQGLDYDAFGDFPGLCNIQEVVLSPDHGQTVWPAKLVEGKGYYVPIPNLPVGAYGLEWGVVSKDKHNRLLLIIIPINWSSRRATAATNQAMIQSPPPSCEGFTDQQWFACLRGFLPAWASLDQGYLAQQGQVPVSSTLPPVAAPSSKPPLPVLPQPNFSGKTKLVLNSEGGSVGLTINLSAYVAVGDRMRFQRDGQLVAEAEVTRVIPGHLIEARVIHGGGIRPQDDIFMKGGQ